jgi:hypothetical protein
VEFGFALKPSRLGLLRSEMMTEDDIKKHHEQCEASKTSRGEWKKEPNRLNWKHAGLDCMLVRHPTLLHWCGYVGLPANHPDFGKDYDSVPVDVHGGLTYAKACDGHICHITENGDDKTWWLGFDCAHLGDCSPGSRSYFNCPGDTYKNLEYVKGETEQLALQLAERK